MPRQEKIDKVEKLLRKLEQCQMAVFTDYRGLPTLEINQLRHHLRLTQSDFHVVKNSLTRIALSKMGLRETGQLLEGPTAVVFSGSAEIALAKAVTNYIKANRSLLQIKGGLLKERLLSQEDVQFLANLSSPQEVRAQMVGLLASPLRNLIYILASQLRGLLTVLQGRIQQLEGGSHA